MQMSLRVLLHLYPFPFEPESLEVDIEPCRDIVASAFHERLFLISKAQLFKIPYLLLNKTAEALRVDSIITVDKAVAYDSTWETVDYRTGHRKFIQVCVCKVGYDWFHHYGQGWEYFFWAIHVLFSHGHMLPHGKEKRDHR